MMEPIQAQNETDCLRTGNVWYAAAEQSCLSLNVGAAVTQPTKQTALVEKDGSNSDPLAFVCWETTSQLILSGMGQDPALGTGP